MSGQPLHIGFIPLLDAAPLLVAVDKGYMADEGLDVTLAREVSWSNVRDKLNIGLFDAAHLLAPIAIASTLGLGHIKVPTIAPFNLGINGNAITVSPELHAAILAEADGDPSNPLHTAQALARVVAARRQRGMAPIVFGMTFPFSTHNYQLRFWMAAGGVNPDEDVRLVVLPPPYMADSLASGQVDAFCVGAPWNSIAVDRGIAHILHFASDIMETAAEKLLALRESWADKHPDAVSAMVRALARASRFIDSADHRDEVVRILSKPEHIGVQPEIITRILAGAIKVSPDGATRHTKSFLVISGDATQRPDPRQAAWLYAQMVRWRQTPLSARSLAEAKAVFRADLYDRAVGQGDVAGKAPPISTFMGAVADPDDIEGQLSSFARSG